MNDASSYTKLDTLGMLLGAFTFTLSLRQKLLESVHFLLLRRSFHRSFLRGSDTVSIEKHSWTDHLGFADCFSRSTEAECVMIWHENTWDIDLRDKGLAFQKCQSQDHSDVFQHWLQENHWCLSGCWIWCRKKAAQHRDKVQRRAASFCFVHFMRRFRAFHPGPVGLLQRSVVFLPENGWCFCTLQCMEWHGIDMEWLRKVLAHSGIISKAIAISWRLSILCWFNLVYAFYGRYGSCHLLHGMTTQIHNAPKCITMERV